MKQALGQSTKDEHKYEVENFILSVFAKTDKEERTCETITKKNALDFKRCGDFIELLTLFGELEPEWKEREKYCKYKAATILKCLKNGEEPPRGNPFAKEENQVQPSMDVDEGINVADEEENKAQIPNQAFQPSMNIRESLQPNNNQQIP